MRIYLFGSNGMIGHTVFYVLNQYYNIITINREQYDIYIDNWNKLETLLSDITAEDIIINCAGIVPQTKNMKDIEYIKVNTLFPHKLEAIAQKNNIKFIHITTDCVFDGKKGKYKETDIHTETNIYGISKSLGEPEKSCIIRTSFIGTQKNKNNGLGLLEWIITNKNSTINGFTNHYWNGITCLTLANIIKQIIEQNLYWIGCRHIYSQNTLSKFELCNNINDIYNLNITINKHETKTTVDKSIMSIYETNGLFKIKPIVEQIIEQKNFLNNIN